MAHDDVAALSYEAARDQLADVVRTLESGQASLEDSLKLWERGEALAAHCQAWLDGARRRLDAATRGAAASTDEGPSGPAAPQRTATPRDIEDGDSLSGESPDLVADLDTLDEAGDGSDLEDAAHPTGGKL